MMTQAPFTKFGTGKNHPHSPRDQQNFLSSGRERNNQNGKLKIIFDLDKSSMQNDASFSHQQHLRNLVTLMWTKDKIDNQTGLV
jgi:hypothetical protein